MLRHPPQVPYCPHHMSPLVLCHQACTLLKNLTFRQLPSCSNVLIALSAARGLLAQVDQVCMMLINQPVSCVLLVRVPIACLGSWQH